MDTHQDTIPWQKQKLVWMLIAIPFSAVVMGMVVIYLAVTTDDGLVAEDYYKKGMTINRQLAKEELAKQMSLTATVDINTADGYIKAIFDKGRLNEDPTSLMIELKHATREKNDRAAVLQKGISNEYVGSVPDGVQYGIWYVELNNSDNAGMPQWRLVTRVRLEEKNIVALQPE